MIAMVDNAAVKLPPGERDFQVYRFVRVETNSTRAAAQMFGVSQTRVRQVVSRVVEYLLAVAREGLKEDEDEHAGSLVVAEQIARMQLEHMYSQAMQSWNDSQRMNGLGQTSLGQARYLALAARISLLMSKVPMHAPPRTREEELDEYDEAEVHAPPARDCSGQAVSRPTAQVASPPAGDPNGCAAASYKSLDEIKAEARRSFLRPAQADTAIGDDSPESGETGAAVSAGQAAKQSLSPVHVRRGLPDHAGRPLSRRQRRARQRELARVLKKR